MTPFRTPCRVRMCWTGSGHFSLLVFVLAACTDEAPDRLSLAAELERSNTCAYREAGSRWAAPSTRYATAGEFGRTEGEELIDVWGLAATPAGELLVFDAGSHQVVRLDRELEPLARVGRAGQGPGEFAYQRAPRGELIIADDTSFVVMDLRAVSTFDANGEFRDYATLAGPRPLPRRLALLDGRVIFVTDEIDFSEGTRALKTWRMESTAPHSLLRTDSMPPLPRWRGRLVQGIFANQGDPLWAMHDGCVYISDGSGDWILRVDLLTDGADTLRLPAREIPPSTKEDEARMERLRRVASSVGTSAGSDAVRPTAPRKWESLRVDPDGFLWLEPWRPHSMRDDPLTIWVVHPATGVVDSVVVEGGAPEAFLPGPSFVSRVYDDEAHLLLLRRYSPLSR